MSKKMKTWLLVAASLVGAGCILFGGALAMAGWDITKLGTVKYETNQYEIIESFENISVCTDTADVILVPSADGSVSVRCLEESRAKHTVEVKNGTLEIRLAKERKWYEHISILDFTSAKIEVSIPQKLYGNLKVQASTGHISLQNISADSLELTVSTGKITGRDIRCGAAKMKMTTGQITLSETQCKTLQAEGSTGDLVLNHVVTEEAMQLKTSTGDVKLSGCDAGKLNIQTSTGDVTGSLLSPKIFLATARTGKVEVPKTTTGGVCEITTKTGDIRLTVTE